MNDQDNKPPVEPKEPITPEPSEEPKAPEAPPVEPKESEIPPVEAPKKLEEPEVDISEIKTEVKKEVTNEILKRLIGKTEEEITEVTGEQSPWSKEGRNPYSYDEITDWNVEVVLKKLDERNAKKEAEAKAKEEEASKLQQERAEAFNKYWDGQLNELFEAGKLPKIDDSKNENDPGVQARKALFTKMIEINEKKVKDGKEPIYSLKEIFYEHYTNEEPGMSAPVSAGRGTVPAEGEEYEYVGKKSFLDIILGR